MKKYPFKTGDDVFVKRIPAFIIARAAKDLEGHIVKVTTGMRSISVVQSPDGEYEWFLPNDCLEKVG